MRMRLLVLVSGLCFVTAACGGSDEPAFEPVAVADFPARFAAEFCGLMERCCEASGGSPEGSCEADLQEQTTGVGNEAAADGATWNAEVAGRCLAAVRDADCGSIDPAALRQLLDNCDDTWDGVVAPGGACRTYASCAEPEVSDGATAGASCVNSECVPVVRQPPGSPCMDTGLQCDPLLASCVTGRCVALPDAGEPCSDTCRSGARCSDGTCVPRRAMGEGCTGDSECASDLCSGGRCASAFIGDGEYCALL